jgi:ribosomal protein L11 methylase PrmA
VLGARPALERAFCALAALQPVGWRPAGLLCAPRAAPALARQALESCPFPTRPLARAPGHPDPPAACVGGFYRRGQGHVPAPVEAGLIELPQAPGEGFGPGDHPTTTLCLEGLRALPAGPALDAGTGSGLLALAWARLGRGPVLAIDLDPLALAQARRAAGAAGLEERIELRRAAVGALSGPELAGRVLLANLPLPAQRALAERCLALGAAPRAALLSGLRPGEAAELLAAYRRLGLRPAGAARRARWERWSLLPA